MSTILSAEVLDSLSRVVFEAPRLSSPRRSMPPTRGRRFWKSPRPRDPSPSSQPRDSIPSVSTSTFAAQRTSPDDSSRSQPTYSPTRSQPTYPDYPHDHAGSRLDSALALASIRVHIPALPGALVGPVTQVLDVLAEISEVVKTMREGKRDCDHLLFRVTMFLDSFVNELKASNVPIPDGSPTAVRLFALKSNLKAIKTDVKRWSEFGPLDRYLKRDEIKTGLLMHGENLTDCLNIYHLMASVRTSTLADSIEKIVFPGPSVLLTRREEGEPSPSALQTVTLQNLQDFLQRPAGRVVFEQIAEALRDRLEEAELGTILTRTDPRSPAMTLVETGHNHPISDLAARISELTVKVDSILPDLAVPTETQERSIGWRSDWPQSEDPAHQLGETVSTTLELLNELHNTAEAKLNVATLADKMSQLSLNLSDLGLWDEAFEVQTTAVILHRAGQDVSGLAASLTELSRVLLRLGRHDEALREAEEATRLYLSLVPGRPEIFRPDLASSFIALSACRSECGLHEDALTAIEQAVGTYRSLRKRGLEVIEEAMRIYRQLAAYRPNMFRPYLARSLNNLSARLSESGRHVEALGASEEALMIHRPLAAYRPNDALEASEEAVSIYRPLAADRPNVFRANFARSVHNFAARLSEFAVDRPDVFRSLLALSLGDLSVRLSGFGHREEALKASEEVVGIYRLLVADRPEAFRSDLARSLGNFSMCLSKLGRHHKALRRVRRLWRFTGRNLTQFGRREEALRANEEAVNIYRSLVADRPVFRSDLADSLRSLSARLSEIGRREEALIATKEALGIYRPLATDRPDVFRPDLARSLGNFSVYLSEFGRHREALEACEEAVNIYRPLAVELPDAFRPDLARSIGNLSGGLSEFGRYADALDASEEAIEFTATSLSLFQNLTVMRNAVKASEESVGHYRLLAGRSTECVSTRSCQLSGQSLCVSFGNWRQASARCLRPHLARSLGNLLHPSLEIGRDKDALEKNEEAENIYRPLVANRPNRYEDSVGSAIEEAMEIYLPRLQVDRPSVFISDLRTLTLHRLRNKFMRRIPARRVIQEPARPNHPVFATSFSRGSHTPLLSLVAGRSEIFSPILPLLHRLSACRSECGLHEGALTQLKQAAGPLSHTAILSLPGPPLPPPRPHPSPDLPVGSQPTYPPSRPQPPYPDYLHDHAGTGWNSALAAASIRVHIPALPGILVGPVTQVLDVASEISEIVKTMRDGKEGCVRLLFRVMMFLDSFVNELKGSNVPIPGGSPTAIRLFALKSHLKAIKTDVKRWSQLGPFDRFLKREEIKIGLLMHGENLTDCLNIHHLVASMRASNLADRIETIMFPGPSASALMTRREDGQDPLGLSSGASPSTPSSVASPSAMPRSATLRSAAPPSAALSSAPPSVTLQSVQDFFQSPVGQTLFQQIAVAVQARLEDVGLRATPAPPDSRSPTMTVLRTGQDHDVSDLTTQISELTVKVDSILPDISVPTENQERSIGWRTHWPQSGDPADQFRETVSTTLELLNELHNTAQAELDVATLADKMSQLSLNLSDLGLWDEAFEVQSTAVTLHRTGQDVSGLSASLTELSRALLRLGRQDEALRKAEEAIRLYLYLSLVADRPEVFRPDLASSFIALSACRSECGLHEEALTAIEQAVEIYRSLVKEQPDVFRPHLARSLENLAIDLLEFGDRKKGLEVIEEAVSIYRLLAAYRPKMFRPYLARSLNNLSTRLSESGRHLEAFGASEEALTIHRPLAADRPNVFRPHLARSLDNFSTDLSQFGRHEEAIKTSEEAVGIYRPLAANQPHVFRAHLARSLHNLSVRLWDFGRRQEALQNSEEAVSIYRPLADVRPDVFRPLLARSLGDLSIRLSGFGPADRPEAFRFDLARSLGNFSIYLSDLGRHTKALRASEEAVEIYRPLATGLPDVFLSDLAHCLGHLATHLTQFDPREEALKANEEAVNIYRPLAADRPVFRSDFADSLHSLSIRLSGIGRREETLKTTEEALAIYRTLATDQPDVFLPYLARSLGNFSLYLSEFGRHREALGACEEAMSIYRPLAVDLPNAFQPDLARQISNLSARLTEFGRHADALEASEEAMRLYRSLAEGRPDVFRPDLARCLGNLSVSLSEFSRLQEAIKASEESVGLYRLLVIDRPDVFRPDLANSLGNLSVFLLELGRREAALKVSEETESIYRPLAADRPDVFRPHLARSAGNLSVHLSLFGRHKEALEKNEEAVNIYRSLAADRPDAFPSNLANSLSNVSRRLSELGRHEEALAAIEEALSIYRPLAADRPSIFNSKLARSLSNLFHVLSNLGQRPAVFAKAFASALSRLSRCHLGMGQHEEALRAQTEADGLGL
ncbi:hypothetical protein BS47DRAFT_1387488 [Hydnum rufescens UP504]|uniref:Anaphase-promoting complex subunit 5 domain-containing protein n=1 Tax=Hydnum rufescens UP504 TaxID=1448309 RepID=A0A9P6DZ39_9AGAM|nr:hypothetical protein BS47DRAFT_1387488 [Hydnum rufescens UP504]